MLNFAQGEDKRGERPKEKIKETKRGEERIGRERDERQKAEKRDGGRDGSI